MEVTFGSSIDYKYYPKDDYDRMIEDGNERKLFLANDIAIEAAIEWDNWRYRQEEKGKRTKQGNLECLYKELRS